MVAFQLEKMGMVFIVSAPSGAGKSTILGRLRAADPTLAYSVSATTRAPRGQEQHGREYYFYSHEDFEKLIAADAFYEHFTVHGNQYGTLKSEIDGKLKQGLDVLLDVDVQGSLRLKRTLPECTTIFILPPSMEELERRLRGRGSDSDDVIQRRLANASGELQLASQYDFLLINQDLDRTVEDVQTIIRAQHFRANRMRLIDHNGRPLISPAQDF